MEFIGNIARKTGDPSLLAVEAAKTKKAGAIGRNSGLFYVPKVLNFNEQTGELDFERVRGLVTLREMAVRKDERLSGLLRRTGEALATIHEHLALSDEMKHELPHEWMDSSDENVFIHGDFTLRNVCFHEPSGQLVILDWSAAPYLGRSGTYGSRFFDIIWFVNYIFLAVPRARLFNWDAPNMADAFLSAYGGHRPEMIGRLSRDFAPLMRRYYLKTVWCLAQQRPWWKATRYLLYQLLIYPRFAYYRLEPGHD
jgi:aminoglycoside phosphotransferase (APT) family kinase protein